MERNIIVVEVLLLCPPAVLCTLCTRGSTVALSPNENTQQCRALSCSLPSYYLRTLLGNYATNTNRQLADRRNAIKII
jgi:hypothetical protein